MKKSIEARYNSHKLTQDTLDNNKAKFAGNPAFVKAYNSFTIAVDNSGKLILKSGSLPKRTAANKEIARDELAAISLKISSALKAFCIINKDNNLASMLITSETALNKSMKQQDFMTYNNQILSIIEAEPEKFSDYGISEALTNELKQELGEYAALINQPRQLINERKTSLELLDESINEANHILRDIIDSLMELYIDEHTFYMEYKAARMIIDPASRKRDTDN